MIHHDLIIVGGGASGLVAAITAKDFGLDVAIVEGTDRIGKKILTTGNGRCNISNRNISFPFLSYHSENTGFFSNVLSNFDINDTENFFLSLGLPIIELQNGKVYPRSLQASSVVDILKLALEDRNIPLYTNCKVKDIHKKKIFKLS
ncbi:NAD(P)/FAD-dependent oxidoreductase, partial [Clostridium perfringens]|uniref:NAD(P)/FAD-dependent oxidoreductase n=1 Tax=Clostridium perfringens TaxID=1502 RepID=UPI002AC6C063